jgi:hypothetical protein
LFSAVGVLVPPGENRDAGSEQLLMRVPAMADCHRRWVRSGTGCSNCCEGCVEARHRPENTRKTERDDLLRRPAFSRNERTRVPAMRSLLGGGFTVALTTQAAAKVASKLVIALKVREKHPKTSNLPDPKWETLQGFPLSRTSRLASP